MTNDESSPNAQARMPTSRVLSNWCFVIGSSFVIRHLSFVLPTPVHVYPQAAEPARLPGRLPGRPQPLRGRLRAARQPVVGAGLGGAAGGPHQLRGAGGD